MVTVFYFVCLSTEGPPVQSGGPPCQGPGPPGPGQGLGPRLRSRLRAGPPRSKSRKAGVRVVCLLRSRRTVLFYHVIIELPNQHPCNNRAGDDLE